MREIRDEDWRAWIRLHQRCTYVSGIVVFFSFFFFSFDGFCAGMVMGMCMFLFLFCLCVVFVVVFVLFCVCLSFCFALFCLFYHSERLRRIHLKTSIVHNHIRCSLAVGGTEYRQMGLGISSGLQGTTVNAPHPLQSLLHSSTPLLCSNGHLLVWIDPIAAAVLLFLFQQ